PDNRKFIAISRQRVRQPAARRCLVDPHRMCRRDRQGRAEALMAIQIEWPDEGGEQQSSLCCGGIDRMKVAAGSHRDHEVLWVNSAFNRIDELDLGVAEPELPKVTAVGIAIEQQVET